MASVAATSQRGDEFGRAFRHNDVALDHNGIATKMHCLLRCDVDQIGNVLGINCLPTASAALAVKTMSGNFGCGGTSSILQFSLERIACKPRHCFCARAASAPRARLIQGLISYSMP